MFQDHSIPSISELIAQAEELRAREEVERQEKSRRGQAFLDYHMAWVRLWMYGSVLVPLGLLWLMGDWLDRELRSAGALAYALTFLAPIVISMVIVKEIVIDIILTRAHDRCMAQIYPGGVHGALPKADRCYLAIKLWSAGSAVVPTALLWIMSGTLDRALSGIDGGLRVLMAGAAIAACFLIVRFALIARVFEPRHRRLVVEELAALCPSEQAARLVA